LYEGPKNDRSPPSLRIPRSALSGEEQGHPDEDVGTDL
jgi:hypothetical protein